MLREKMRQMPVKLTLLLAALLGAAFFAVGTHPAYAAEITGEMVPSKPHRVSSVTGRDNDALFADYLDSLMYPGKTPSGSSARRKAPRKNNLNDAEKAIYSALYEAAAQIACGQRDSAEISIPFTGVVDKLYYTKEELGVSWLYRDGEGYNPEATEQINLLLDATWPAFDDEGYYDPALFSDDAVFNPITVIDALLTDIPYEFYWFDKTKGYGWYPLFVYDRKKDMLKLTRLVYQLSAAPDYWPEGYTGPSGDEFPTAVNQEKCGSASAAVAYAGVIAEEAEGYSDHEKLLYFRTTIRSLVTYDNEAASSTDYYGDPWQIIYVFDNNPDTNVVCEGYAKAFKYLCDLSAFSDPDMDCYLVTGGLGTISNAHMWNLMHMEDGENYLVDLTNSSSESRHFLSGGSMFGTYGSTTFGVNDGTCYYYDADSMNLFSKKELTVAPASYTNMVHVEEISCPDTLSLYTDEIAEMTASVSPDNASDQTVSWSSSDLSVVTVEADASGKCTVTPVKAGEAVVTVETVDRHCTASCSVTVLQHVTGISLEPEMEVWIGDEPTALQAQILPEDASDQAVSWSSADPGIASVDAEGAVTPAAVGRTVITAESADGGFTASCTVTVKKHVEEISLSETQIALERFGEDVTAHLDASVLPADASDPAVTWTSADPETAEVLPDEDGCGCTMTAKKGGSVRITAATKDLGLTAFCDVTVLQHVTGISFDHTNESIYLESEPLRLSYHIVPEDADDQEVTWESSRPEIASVDEQGAVSPHAAGTAVVTATAKDGAHTASVTVTVSEKPKEAEAEGSENPDAAGERSSDGTAEEENAEQPGADGTALGKGASLSLAEKTLLADTSDRDGRGSVFRKLCARKKAVKRNRIQIRWNRVSGAKAYIVYGAKCGSRLKKLAAVKGTSYTHKKLKKGTYYKYVVVAADGVGTSAKVLSTSKTLHITTLGGKKNNYRALKLNRKSARVKRKKTVRLKAKAVKIGKKASVHRKISYESSDPKIAAVSSKGLVRGMKKGKCRIYVYAQDGTYTAVSIYVV